MFNIPSFYEMPNMTFEEAKSILTIDGDLLKGMEHINAMWDRYVAGDSYHEDDDDFFNTWEYEVNAYNVVFEKMAPLFAPAK